MTETDERVRLNIAAFQIWKDGARVHISQGLPIADLGERGCYVNPQVETGHANPLGDVDHLQLDLKLSIDRPPLTHGKILDYGSLAIQQSRQGYQLEYPEIAGKSIEAPVRNARFSAALIGVVERDDFTVELKNDSYEESRFLHRFYDFASTPGDARVRVGTLVLSRYSSLRIAVGEKGDLMHHHEVRFHPRGYQLVTTPFPTQRPLRPRRHMPEPEDEDTDEGGGSGDRTPRIPIGPKGGLSVELGQSEQNEENTP